MNFADAQLQKCYEANFAHAKSFSDELRQVCALIEAHDMFQMLEGPHSARVHEAIWQLLLPKLRSGLRRWYLRPGTNQDPAAVALREHLSQLAGEPLGTTTHLLQSQTTTR